MGCARDLRLNAGLSRCCDETGGSGYLRAPNLHSAFSLFGRVMLVGLSNFFLYLPLFFSGFLSRVAVIFAAHSGIVWNRGLLKNCSSGLTGACYHEEHWRHLAFASDVALLFFMLSCLLLSFSSRGAFTFCVSFCNVCIAVVVRFVIAADFVFFFFDMA